MWAFGWGRHPSIRWVCGAVAEEGSWVLVGLTHVTTRGRSKPTDDATSQPHPALSCSPTFLTASSASEWVLRHPSQTLS